MAAGQSLALSTSGSPRKATKVFPLCSGLLLQVIKVKQVEKLKAIHSDHEFLLEICFQDNESMENVLGITEPCQVKVTQHLVFRKQNLSATKANSNVCCPSFFVAIACSWYWMPDSKLLRGWGSNLNEGTGTVSTVSFRGIVLIPGILVKMIM